MNKPIRISVFGTRGFPDIQGGVEKHCESLYPIIGQNDCEVNVFRRTPYIKKNGKPSSYYNVHFRDFWTIRRKNLEAIIHSFFCTLYCCFERPDIVHIHNIGPSIFLPLIWLSRLKSVITYHSPNYRHSKWGWIAKKVLKVGESFVFRFANHIIFVSGTEAKNHSCNNMTVIPNGILIQQTSVAVDFVRHIGAEPGKYILAVARLVPEKGLIDLIEAFKSLETKCKLVIAGDADHETAYSRRIRLTAREDSRVILTGYITGESLKQIYSHARLFVLPSYNEGHPIALLEALSYGLPVLVSDIPGNKEVPLMSDRYFKCGNVKDLRNKIQVLIKTGISDEEKKAIRKILEEKYNWEKIAVQTIEVYRKVIGYS